VQRNSASIDDPQARRESVIEARGLRRAPSAGLRSGAGWLGSSFDLAQGLEVTVMDSKLSREDLDELFRS
jgi:hypothetical protein